MFIRFKFHSVSYISSGNSSQIGVQERQFHNNREKKSKEVIEEKMEIRKWMEFISRKQQVTDYRKN